MDLTLDSYRSAVDAAAIFTETDNRGRITYANPQFCAISGYSLEELLGANHRIVSSGTHDPAFFSFMWATISRGQVWKGIICNRTKEGALYWVDSTIVPIVGAGGGIEKYVSIRFDITERQALLDNLKWRVDHDPLAGLMNRDAITAALEAKLATRAKHESLAIVMLDIDEFKKINDFYGRPVGDQLLGKFASRLSNALGARDMVGRIGSNTFLVILTSIADEGKALDAIQTAMLGIKGSYLVDEHRLMITASAGYTMVPGDEEDAGVLFRHAIQALYLAKHAEAKNSVERFDLESNEHIRSSLRQVARLKQALLNDGLCLYYQPKVRMSDGMVVGFEALIRWIHPTQGIIPPNDFLPYIEEHDLIVQIGEWCITNALRQLELWRSNGLEWSVSVNIAARHFQRTDFVERLRLLINESRDYKRNSLDLELVESVALTRLEHVSHCIDECYRLGVTASLDDFGTGYSSLSYLKRLRTKTIKIDRAFVQGITGDAEDRELVEAIVKLAISFRRSIVAEGVETAEQAALLKNMGCEIAQGYLYSRPMAVDQVIPWFNGLPLPSTTPPVPLSS